MQIVLKDAHLSKEFPVLRGFPQGSILGPTLILLHLDDIDNCLRHSSIIKYADDTLIYVSGNDSESIQKKLNADILEVHNWLTDNDLSLNLKKGKTESMIFGTSIHVKKAAPKGPASTKQLKGPASTKHHLTNIRELTLTQHWHWMVTSIQNTKISVPDCDYCQNYAQIWRWQPQKCSTRVVYSSIYILWNCKSKSIEDITWKTWSNSWTSCWYHHQNQSSEVNPNNELCEMSCLPNRQQKTLDNITKSYNKSSPKWILLSYFTLFCLINLDFNFSLICLNSI